MSEILITSSVLIVVIALLRTLLKGKISLRLQYALWLLVALRLLIPVSFVQSPVSVMNMVAAVGRVTEQTVPSKAPQTPGIMEPSTGGNVNTGTNFIVPAAPSGQTAPAGPKAPANAAEIAKMVWLAGIGGMALWFLVSDSLFRRKLKRSAGWLEGIKCGLPVYVTQAVPSPCLYGLFWPAVYLTPDCLENESTLRHVLAHEETHYRHRDQIWSMVRCVCLTIFWFNPLVWLAAALSRRDCELACDEGAISRLGEGERLFYGRTLLSMVVPKSAPGDLLCTATTMTSGKNGLKERIALIAKRPKAALATVVAVVLIAAVAVGCTFTGAQGSKKPDAPVEEALTVLPEELRDSVVLKEDGEAEVGELLAAYYYKEDVDAGYDGWMRSVARLTPAEFEQSYYGFNEIGGASYLGRDTEWYYVLLRPTDVRTMHYETYGPAVETLQAWVEGTFAQYEDIKPMEEDAVYRAFTGDYSYDGFHANVIYRPYYGLTNYGAERTDTAYTFLLSQPVNQGEWGVWCVDRWYDENGTAYMWIPETDMTLAEYYADLQAKADAGEADWTWNPAEVCMRFVKEQFDQDRPAEAFQMGDIYEGEPKIESTAITINGGVENRLGELLSAGAQLAVPDENGAATWQDNYPVSDQSGNGSSYAARMVEEYTWSDKAEDAYFNGGTLEPETYDWQMLLYQDGGAEFRFYAGSNVVRYYDLANGTAWYEALPKEGGKGVAELVRDWFYEEEYLNSTAPAILAADAGSFEWAAQSYADGVAQGLKGLTPGSPWAVEEAKLYKTEVLETLPEDNTLFCFKMSLALVKEDILNSPYNAGAGTVPMEEFPSAQLWTMEVVMRWENGEWRRVAWGNEGYKLENYQQEAE